MAVEENCVDGTERSVAMATNCNVQNGVLSVGRFVVANGSSVSSPHKETNGLEDDELTSLSWLQDTNLLKNFQMGACGIEGEDVLSDTPSSDYMDESVEHVTLNCEQVEPNAEQLTLPGHMPYHPTLHANSKPPYSFSCLIFMAIEDSLNKALPVKDIYNWILSHFPYFQSAPTGWKNSVRHNLSLSKCFRKVEKEKGQNIGKGSLWCIDPEYRPNLIQALQKAPSMANVEFSHFAHLSPPLCQNGKSESDIKPCLLVSSQQAIKIPSPELFPYLARRLASSVKDPEVDAAATMLTLKNGPSRTVQNFSEESETDIFVSVQRRVPRKRLRHKQSTNTSNGKKMKATATATATPVITSSPSEDHTYSACLSQEGATTSPCLSPVRTNELQHECTEDTMKSTSGDLLTECTSTPQSFLMESPQVAKEEDEVYDDGDNSAAEGAHALMNLAKIATKRLLKKTRQFLKDDL